jgi:glycosyltransferase involved in cell wall biosynthesis
VRHFSALENGAECYIYIDHLNLTMKVAIIQGAFLPVPPTRGGAVEKLWHRLGIELASRGAEVTHICRLVDGQSVDEFADGVRYMRFHGFDWSSSSTRNRISDLIYSIRVCLSLGQFDAIITNTFFSPVILWILKRKNIYVSAHRFPRGQYWLYRHASRIQCVSNSVAEAITMQTPSVAKLIKVIPNFVPTPELPITPYGNRENIILYVGRLAKEKGVDLLIAAYRDLPPDIRRKWKLTIVGPHELKYGGDGQEYFDKLRKIASESEPDGINFTGAVFDKARLAKLYSSAKIFVYPSIAEEGEAFGLAPLEAMSYGIPTVLSSLSCFNEFLNVGKNGVTFNHHDDDPIRELSLCLSNFIKMVEDNGASLSESAKLTALKFDLSSIANKFFDDLRHITGRQDDI